MIRTRQLFIMLGLALGAGIATGCVVRGSASMSGSTTPVVYQEPPAPQVEAVTTRPGHIWIRGRWDWQNGQWMWIGGHWERERAGYAWGEGRWERRGNSWHWVDGQWAVSSGGTASGGVIVTDTNAGMGAPSPRGASGGVVVTDSNTSAPQPSPRGASGGVVVSGGGMYPTVAPPPPRSETSSAQAGYVWVGGRWNWVNGQWQWLDGHVERQKAHQMWVAGRWELQGNYYVWIDGRWETEARPAPAGPAVRDHRH